MSTSRLVGLNVIDQQLYQTYRDAMLPILRQYGGEFVYDIVVDHVLKSPTQKPINRLFIIIFENTTQEESFFSDDTYLAIRERYFNASVADITIISHY